LDGIDLLRKLVLPDRIELSTSPLPMVRAKVRKHYFYRGFSASIFDCTDFAQMCIWGCMLLQ
jgi:hypothetical protein